MWGRGVAVKLRRLANMRALQHYMNITDEAKQEQMRMVIE